MIEHSVLWSVALTFALASAAYTPRLHALDECMFTRWWREVEGKDTLFSRLRRQRMRGVDPALAADLLGAALAGGSAIPTALLALHRALEEDEGDDGLDIVARSLLMGGSWSEAWSVVPERFAPLREALEPAWVDGAAPQALLERAAANIRQSRMREAREAAGVLASRLVLPLGLCFLPAFIAVGVIPVVAAAGISVFGR